MTDRGQPEILTGSCLCGGSYPGGPEVAIRFGALDDDPGIRPQFRV